MRDLTPAHKGADRAGGNADQFRRGGVADPLSTFSCEAVDFILGEADPAVAGVFVDCEAARCHPPLNGGGADADELNHVTRASSASIAQWQ